MKQAAIELGLAETTYRNYEHEVSEPSLTVLAKLSAFYSIDVDWILGLDKKDGIPPESRWDTIQKIIEGLPEQEVHELLLYLRFLQWKVEERKKQEQK